MNTAGRRAALHRIIEREYVGSQSQAAALLAAAGYPATQATVSRDLTAIGAKKVRDEIGSRYRLGATVSLTLGSTIDQFVLDVVPTGNLVVIKTPPAVAHYVASELDRSGLAEVAGTVAGDDTLLVVAAPGHTGREVADLLVGSGT
jgi:transcriptional regulator of arginine metabolism